MLSYVNDDLKERLGLEVIGVECVVVMMMMAMIRMIGNDNGNIISLVTMLWR